MEREANLAYDCLFSSVQYHPLGGNQTAWVNLAMNDAQTVCSANPFLPPNRWLLSDIPELQISISQTT